MSDSQDNIPRLIQKLVFAGREYAGRSLMFHQAVADRMGVNATDFKCLDLARGAREMTPTKLAELTGLTTGSITAVLDRLEAAGYVRRIHDQDDRRKVKIEFNADQVLPKLEPVFASLSTAMAEAVGTRYTRDDLTAILDFIETSSQVLQAETEKIKGLH